MKSRFYPVILLVVLAGCTQPRRNPGDVIVIPGRGIPKVAELTMSLAELRKTVDDLKVEAYPALGLPGQRNVFGDRLRLPGERPEHYTAVSRSLGLSFSTYNERKPVQLLTFFSDPAPFCVDSNTWFTGQLSCGLSFKDRRRVGRAEVVAVFGEPSSHQPATNREAWRIVEHGTSLAVRGSNGVENLWYPTNGISFCLRDDTVISFDIRQVVKQSEGGK